MHNPEEAARHEGWEEGFREGQLRMQKRAAQILEGDILLTADEFQGITKTKVFDLANRIFKQIIDLEVDDN